MELLNRVISVVDEMLLALRNHISVVVRQMTPEALDRFMSR